TGYRLQGELQVGDQVHDAHGGECRVIELHPIYSPEKEVYEIVFDDGNKVVADSSHNWPVMFNEKAQLHNTEVLAFLLSNKTFSQGIHVAYSDRRMVDVNKLPSIPVRCISV